MWPRASRRTYQQYQPCHGWWESSVGTPPGFAFFPTPWVVNKISLTPIYSGRVGLKKKKVFATAVSRWPPFLAGFWERSTPSTIIIPKRLTTIFPPIMNTRRIHVQPHLLFFIPVVNQFHRCSSFFDVSLSSTHILPGDWMRPFCSRSIPMTIFWGKSFFLPFIAQPHSHLRFLVCFLHFLLILVVSTLGHSWSTSLSSLIAIVVDIPVNAFLPLLSLFSLSNLILFFRTFFLIFAHRIFSVRLILCFTTSLNS